LREQVWRVDVRSIEHVEGVAAYDAFVLGSAIHDRTWLPPAAEFIHRNAAELAARPVWLFGVGMLGDEGSALAPAVTAVIRRLWKEPKVISDIRPVIHPRDYHTFVGAVQPEHFPLTGRVLFKVMGAHYGDHRDWREIRAWALHIAHDMPKVETLAPSAEIAGPAQRNQASSG
jgi:menaquinone-dependent protoporphyrinogen oxidase